MSLLEEYIGGFPFTLFLYWRIPFHLIPSYKRRLPCVVTIPSIEVSSLSLPSNLCHALKLFTKSKVSLPDCLDQSSFIVIGTPLSAPLTVGIGSRLQPPALATQFVRALASSLLVPTSPRFLPIPLSLSFCNCDFPRLRPPVPV